MRLADGPHDRMMSASPASRPSSSGSMSRYNILPAIGSTKPGRPYASPPAALSPTSSPLQGKSPSVEPAIHELKGLNITGDSSEAEESKGSKESIKSEVEVPESEESFRKLDKETKLPPEPKDGEEKILLAVKLPNGRRVQRNFSPSHTLQMVLNFAEVSASLDFTDCDLVCPMPKQAFSTLSVTIRESGLHNRTVLHIEKPDNE